MSLAEIFDYLWSLVEAAWNYPIPWRTVLQWVGAIILIPLFVLIAWVAVRGLWSFLIKAWAVIDDCVAIVAFYTRRFIKRARSKLKR